MARGIVGLPPVALSLHSISNLMKTVSNDEKDIASHESRERTLMKPATLAPERREGRTPLERSSPENFLPASKQVYTGRSHISQFSNLTTSKMGRTSKQSVMIVFSFESTSCGVHVRRWLFWDISRPETATPPQLEASV